MLDFSRRAELRAIAPVVLDLGDSARRSGVEIVLAGAFARDLLLFYAHGIDTGRGTRDIDFAVAVQGWEEFESLGRTMIASGRWLATSVAHRFDHRSGVPVDLVPFSGVEDPSRHISWPPDGVMKMDAFGLREAFAAAIPLVLPLGAEARIITLPALLLLKLVAWSDRHVRSPGKDAHDIWLILVSYLDCGGRTRLFEEFPRWLEEDDFDNDRAAARMFGIDVAGLLDEAGRRRLTSLLAPEVSLERPGVLPGDLCRGDPDRARELLASFLEGLTE